MAGRDRLSKPMNTNRILRSVLGQSIDAARAALRELESDEVPVRLRPIAKRGDGRLPLPLVRSLLRYIDDDWFRGKTLEAFDRRGNEDAISRAFLEREPGWWITVAEAVAGAEVADAEDRLHRLERDAKALRARASADRAKLKAARQQSDAAARASQASTEERLDPLRTAATEARNDRDRAVASASAMQAEIEVSVRDRLEAERTAAFLSEEIRSARRTVARLRRSSESGASESIPRDPMEIARWIDNASAALTPYREAGTAATEEAQTVGDISGLPPAGVAPDSGAAIEALSGLSGRTVLIDGHNLLGVLDASTMATGRARRELMTRLGKLARHLGDSTIELVFDSDLESGRPTVLSPAGMVVRFALGDRIADDLIVERTEEIRRSAVVVSNDREVRERCGRLGATVLWSQALAEWL